MSTHKHFDKICCVVLVLTLILTLLFVNAGHFGVQKASTVMGYEKTLFDTSRVHTIDIIMDDWDEFTANCKSEEYYNCTVVIDDEAYKNVAIRGKGNTSLSQVSNDRYSYKIEFDHYDSNITYYGLDKLCLNNIIQDNTYMKDYLTYQMMNEMGVAAPLCSYVYITVNGEDWGLYLAVEGVEESFLQRNYGKDYGELYKPDSADMGGGRGNGEGFDMDAFLGDSESESMEDTSSDAQNEDNNDNAFPQLQDGNQNGMQGGRMPDGQMQDEMRQDDTQQDDTQQKDMTPPNDLEMPDGMEMPNGDMQQSGGKEMMNGSDDVLLKYIDDDAGSYANIFDNAKTNISEADQTRLIKALKKLSDGEDLDSTVDIDAVIRYFVVHNFVLNFDSYTGSMIHNYYLYEEDGQMQMIPWDYNLAFGGFQSMEDATTLVNYPIDSPVSGGNVEDRPMIAWIFDSEEYTELYHQYFAEFISEYFDSGYFEEMIDSVTAMISPYVEKDPTKFCTYEEFETGIATLREFCLLRAESVSDQLDGSIGSTSDTQKTETLVDAGNIEISDMGSMNNTMGGDMSQPGENIQNPEEDLTDGAEQQIPDMNGDSDNLNLSEPPSGDSDTTEDNTNGKNPMQQMPGNQGEFDGQMQTPDGSMAQNGMEQNVSQTQQSSASGWIMMGVCVFVLVLGLVFAFVYKRRR